MEKKGFCDQFGKNFGRNFVVFVKNLLARHFLLFSFFVFFKKFPGPIKHSVRTSYHPKVFVVKSVARAFNRSFTVYVAFNSFLIFDLRMKVILP